MPVSEHLQLFPGFFSALQQSPAFLLLSHWQSSCQKVTWSSWQFSPGPVYHFRVQSTPGFWPLIFCGSNRSPLREIALGFLAEVCSDIYQEIQETYERGGKKGLSHWHMFKKEKKNLSMHSPISTPGAFSFMAILVHFMLEMCQTESQGKSKDCFVNRD